MNSIAQKVKAEGINEVIHVVGSLNASHGGPSYVVPRLCNALLSHKVKPTLMSVDVGESDFIDQGEKRYDDLRFSPFFSTMPVIRSFRFSVDLRRALRQAVKTAHIVHNHGLWLEPNLEAAWAAQNSQIPLLVTPHGMLGVPALAISSGKKQIFWQVFRRAISSACFHALSEHEYLEIRRFGVRNPVAVIPSGIDVPSMIHPPNEIDARGVISSSDERILLFFGRIHPIKGLDRLLHAWAALEARHSNWRLRIVGPAAENYDEVLQKLATELGVRRVSIEGPIYGQEKNNVIGSTDLFVLPTLSENFAISVAESLAAGIPAIVTKGAPWPGLETHGCGWWIDHGVEPLRIALEEAMSLPKSTLRVMGGRGRRWVVNEFVTRRVDQWSASIALQLLHIFAASDTIVREVYDHRDK